MEMLVVLHKEIKPVNKEHQSILDLKLLFRNYNARVVFVCFEVPCCFEVHILVLRLDLSFLQKTCISPADMCDLSIQLR